MPHSLRFAALCTLVAVTAVAPGCGKRLQSTVGLLNQPPTVQIERPSISGADDETVTARLHWTGTDIDGRVDHYLVTRDLTTLSHESGWTAVAERDRTLSFRRASRLVAAPAQPARDAFEFFAVRAVDDRGAMSQPATLVFFDDDVAPTVQIDSPRPSSLLSPTVPPDLRIRWTGSDADGPEGRPAKYKYKLWIRSPAIPWDAWIQDPDSLRRQFAPAFAGWDSCSGESTSVMYRGLSVNQEYLFAITALDAQGAYDPVFSLNKNLLRFDVAMPDARGPRLTLFNEYFQYSYPSGGLPTVIDSSWVVRIQAPASRPLTVNWYAEPMQLSMIQAYRWALDIADVRDETPRYNKFDLAHWSAWSLIGTSATVDPAGPHPLTGTHRLYVEAQDNLGWVSLGVVEFTFVSPVFDRDLLIVNDTRFAPDQIVSASRPDTLRPPFGVWPTRAELDTFLFATGGVRWKMTPPGRLSPEGVFKGYRFDTLGTRRGLVDPTIPLEVLGHYRHIVWMTDQKSGNWTDAPNSHAQPMTTLRYMSSPNRQNTLATWVEGGGKLWALGGGFGNATNSAWNNLSNDVNGQRTYSSVGARPDLTPGRFMYDLVHWRSEFKVLGPIAPTVARAPFTSAGGAPNGYTLLPALLRYKSPATDPIWPYRSSGDFYVGNRVYSQNGVYLEYLSLPNPILEARNPSPRHQNDIQGLDTLMVATEGLLPPPGADPAVDRIVNPVMTYYHGRDCGPVVFSGFDVWHWSRADCVQLVDAVLQGVWQLSRDGGSAVAARRAPTTTPPVSRPADD